MLSQMDEQSYTYHVTDEKNDFSNWVCDAFSDHRMANEQARSHNKDEATRASTCRIARLNRKLR